MKLFKNIFFFICLCFFAGLQLSCEKSRKIDQTSGPIQVKLPITVDGQTQFRIVQINSLKNRKNLEGDAARFYMNARISSGRVIGVRPWVEMVEADGGYFVPQDPMSIQLLSLYYHFEKLSELDEKLKIKKLVAWPRPVAVNVNYRSKDNEGQALENNALYSGEFDTLLLVPYTEQGSPFTLNEGVIAHEHFHAIFQKFVLEKLKTSQKLFSQNGKEIEDLLKVFVAAPDEILPAGPLEETQSDDLLKLIYIRGVNEGLADIWGWIYSNDSNYIARSLPNEGAARKLDVHHRKMDSRMYFNSIVQRTATHASVDISYQFGTQIARVIHGYANLKMEQDGMSIDQVRTHVAEMIVRNLATLKDAIEAEGDQWSLAPVDMLRVLFKPVGEEKYSEQECSFFRSHISEVDLEDGVLKDWICVKGKAKASQ